MQNSALLNYLLKAADALRAADERKSVSANHFFVALLQVIFEKEKKENVSAELTNVSGLNEFMEIGAALKQYALDYASVIQNILAYIRQPNYDSAIDDFIFRKIIQYGASIRAKKLGRTEIDSYVILTLIMEEPTPAIKKYVIGSANAGKKDTPVVDIKKTSFDVKKTNALNDLNGENPAPQEPAVSQPTEPPKEALTGLQRLSKTVGDTRTIQKFLLEHIFGQDQAINTFVSGYFQAELMAQSRDENRKPQATFLFAGPPGVGKTYLAEMVAEALKLPFRRFDMSEYSDNEANIEFCGSDKVYKNAQAGNVTSFVAENPRCVLLFDEIEKAHTNVIYLFLQLLDAGRLRDNFTDQEVSFSNAVIIFTTNAGKNLYDDPTAVNLSSLPRKKVLKALSTDINPETHAPLFPAAICSRFASGNVVMFNHLGVNNLFTIATRELKKNVDGFEKNTGIKINVDEKVATAIILSEGGKADARTVKGRANAFFHEELYELFRLLAADPALVEHLKTINVNVSIGQESTSIAKMFVNTATPEVLIFAAEDKLQRNGVSPKGIVCHITSDIAKAKDILFNHDISVILCDVYCKRSDAKKDVLNAEDISSVGGDFLAYALANCDQPVYLLQDAQDGITQEEFLSFARKGVQDVLSLDEEKTEAFEEQLQEKCNIAYQQDNMLKLARENKVLTYKTSQMLSNNNTSADITLFGFKLGLATDVDDSKNILDNVSKPNIRFNQVIGAEDAKKELTYFVQYLKDPKTFARKGVRAPKGVLLYGPPGTGKTMLAKAMAGESDVTFLIAEGNQFLKKYVGEGADAVHSLFAAARKYAPSILFIDEIDAIGKDRNASGSGDSTGDVLTAFLTEMDGFKTDASKPVFVLAATNYEVEQGNGGKTLDPALLRRFDRRIYVDLPTKDERKQYLQLKAAGSQIVTLSDEQIENIAVRSTGMSLAELDSIYEMALRNAVRSENCVVDDAAFEEAFETFNSGEQKQWSKDGLERTARHEAGHALLCWMGGEKPSYLTIVARGNHGGYMQHANSEGKGLYTKDELLKRIRTALAGRAAEIVYYGENEGVSTGASGDLHTATKIAEQMICNYGMDEKIGLSYLTDDETSSLYFNEIRKRVNEILAEELRRTVRIVEENKAAIDKMVEALMEKNHLKEKEIDDIFLSTVKKN